MLSDIPVETDPRVLVDFRTADDAGVYAWEAGPALVQTVDFFTPIVDDPYIYGEIAAANSLSDVYAMGGRPLTALAVAGFPEDLVDAATIAQVFKGGHDTLRRAGVVLLGGHTVRDREIKFGYAVTGAVSPDRIWTNAGARPGDVLLLTKPIGTGIIGTAIKVGRAPAAVVERAVAGMRTLNRAAAEALATWTSTPAPTSPVLACSATASEMARASGVGLETRGGGRARSSMGWWSWWRRTVRAAWPPTASISAAPSRLDSGVPPAVADLLFDPQTSGGLLVAVPDGQAARALEALAAGGVTGAVIGGSCRRRQLI